MTGALQLTNVSDMQVMEVNGVKTWAVIAKHHPFPSLNKKMAQCGQWTSCKPVACRVMAMLELKVSV